MVNAGSNREWVRSSQMDSPLLTDISNGLHGEESPVPFSAYVNEFEVE